MKLSSARDRYEHDMRLWSYFCVSNIKVDNVKEIIVTEDQPDKSTFGWGVRKIVTMGDQPLDIPEEFNTRTLKKGTNLYNRPKKGTY